MFCFIYFYNFSKCSIIIIIIIEIILIILIILIIFIDIKKKDKLIGIIYKNRERKNISKDTHIRKKRIEKEREKNLRIFQDFFFIQILF